MYPPCPKPPGEKHQYLVRVGQSLCFTSAAAAPRRPSHAGAGDASPSVIVTTVKFGGCSHHHIRRGKCNAGLAVVGGGRV